MSKRLAEAVIHTAYRYEVSHGMNAYNECNHCPASVYWDEAVSTMEHDSECPVLLAEAIMKN